MPQVFVSRVRSEGMGALIVTKKNRQGMLNDEISLIISNTLEEIRHNLSQDGS